MRPALIRNDGARCRIRDFSGADRRAYLGRPAIAEGAPADLVVYPADPRQEIGVLAHPTAVIRRGRVVG